MWEEDDSLRWLKRIARTELANVRRGMVTRADTARDERRYREAGVLYAEALRLGSDPGLEIQAGHMFKEAGDIGRAEFHYSAAARLLPEDADLALQMGHFFKVAGRLADAQAWYRKAAELDPRWEEPVRELSALPTANPGHADPTPPGLEGQSDRLVPELVPRRPQELLHAHREAVELRQLGRVERSFWGPGRTLRGVEALRGFCVSLTPIAALEIMLDGRIIHRGPVKGGYPLAHESERPDLRKYVFNVWHDFSSVDAGRHAIEFRLIDDQHNARVHRAPVIIAAALPEDRYPGSDGVIASRPAAGQSLDEWINGRPSMIRAARRTLLDRPPRSILVLRTDQLGDMVAAIPALKRLRAMAPDARIVGLVSTANADFARTLDWFDEVIVIEFPDDKVERRRLMPLDKQEELRRRLEPFAFDIAIDLAESAVSRPLLLLSGARHLFGVGDAAWPWLTIGIDFNSHDIRNRLDIIPHSTKTVALIEAIGATLRINAEVMRRDDLDRDRLQKFGLGTDRPYAILHTGARIAFSHWPNYVLLAERMLAETDLHVVFLSEAPLFPDGVPVALRESDRWTVLDMRLDFDDLDALLSFCTIFVGNDSGPKHLAALRGVRVVSLHTARINWSEWGQEMSGSIMSRKVPCAGCALFHDPEECGKDFACITRITPDEVFTEVRRQLTLKTDGTASIDA